MALEIVNPLEILDWDDILLATEGASIFHSAAWTRVLHESYGYRPLYFASLENGRLFCLMPFMEVNSWITGKRGVSLPFSDYCQPLCSNTEQFQEMVLEVTKHAKEAGWKYLEWRSADSYFANEPAYSSYYVHDLNLEPSVENLFCRFRESTRRNIKKSATQGLKVEILNSPDSVTEFYRLHCMSRKQHGVPPQPFRFFKSIFDHIISTKKGMVILALYRETAVAGAVFFHFGEKALFKFGASNRKFNFLRPNNLVMWEAIKWCKSNSFKALNLGRTDLDDTGLMQFKNGWGTEKGIIHYHKLNLQKGSFERDNRRLKVAGRFVGNLPSPIFNLLGSVLYRHVG